MLSALAAVALFKLLPDLANQERMLTSDAGASVELDYKEMPEGGGLTSLRSVELSVQ